MHDIAYGTCELPEDRKVFDAALVPEVIAGAEQRRISTGQRRCEPQAVRTQERLPCRSPSAAGETEWRIEEVDEWDERGACERAIRAAVSRRHPYLPRGAFPVSRPEACSSSL